MTSETLLDFSKSVPKINCSYFDDIQNSLYTGHKNGTVLKWSLESGEYEKVHVSDSEVTSIRKSNNDIISISHNSGALYLINESNGAIIYQINAAYNKYSRIWRTLWIDDQHLVYASTYGKMILLDISDSSNIAETHLDGHSNSIFGNACAQQ